MGSDPAEHGEGLDLGLPQSVTAAAESGDRLELLVAMRDRLARTVDDEKTSPRDLAPLSRLLRDISREIEALESREEGGDDDVLVHAPDEEWDPEAL